MAFQTLERAEQFVTQRSAFDLYAALRLPLANRRA
jgi:hypothetical protein